MRRRRFSRCTVPNIRITERDRTIMALVYEYRVLDSRQIAQLLGSRSVKKIVERLQLLYHHGFLDRPQAQIISSRYTVGSRPIIYALGARGADLLALQYGELRGVIRWGYKNSRLQYRYLEHRLMVSGVMVACTTSARNHDVALVAQRDVLRSPSNRLSNPIHIKDKKLSLAPDHVFVLKRNDEQEAYFFLELDRGTMPVCRKKRSRASSIYGKLTRYARLFEEKHHRTALGIANFRVLFVSSTEARIARMIKATRDFPRSQGIFLFAQYDEVIGSDALTLSWTNGRQERVTLS